MLDLFLPSISVIKRCKLNALPIAFQIIYLGSTGTSYHQLEGIS